MAAIENFITIKFLAMSKRNVVDENAQFVPVVRDWQSAKNFRGEVNNLPSLTVPDMTMTLEQLLQRYTRGEQVATFTPVFNGDDDFLPDVDRMTTMDKIDLLNDLKVGINHLRDQVSKPKVVPSTDATDKPDAEAATM